MHHFDLLPKFMRRLLHHYYVLLAAFLAGPFVVIAQVGFGFEISWWILVLVINGALLIACYLVFADVSSDVAALKRNVEQRELELLDLKATRPTLEVSFLDTEESDPVYELSLTLPPAPDNGDLEVMLDREREWVSSELELQNSGEIGLNSLLEISGGPSRGEFERYSDRFNTYITELANYRHARARVWEFKPYIVNSGTVNADRVKILFKLPHPIITTSHEEVRLFETEDVPLPPARPSGPRHLSGLGLLDSLALDPGILGVDTSSFVLTSSVHYTNPNYDEKSSWFSYEIPNLVPKASESDLQPVPLWLGDVEEPGGYTITVKVYATSLPEPQEFQLVLNLSVQRIGEEERK